MKLIHFADLHIGMENYGSIDPQTGLSSRLAEFLKSLDELVKYAQNQKVDAVLFSGDAYKTRDPEPTYQREFAKRIKKISSFGIPVALLVGNHDTPNALGKANTLDIFSALRVKNVKVIRKIETIIIETTSGPLQIIGLPWLTKSDFLKKDDISQKTVSESDQIFINKIQKTLKKVIQNIDSKIPTILMTHASIENSVYSSERGVILGSDIVIPKKIFQQPKINYVALGHIHKYQNLNSGQNPPIVYSGSLQKIDFGEEKEKKGFVEINILNQKTNFRFIEIPSTKFLTIKIKIESSPNPTEYIINQLKKYDFKDAIVRLQITGDDEILKQIYESEIKKNLTKAKYLASISKEGDLAQTQNKIIYSNNLATPLEMLSEYLEKKNISKSHINELKEYAKDLISEIEQ